MAALGGSTGGKPTLPVPNKNQGPINCVIVLCFLQKKLIAVVKNDIPK